MVTLRSNRDHFGRRPEQIYLPLHFWQMPGGVPIGPRPFQTPDVMSLIAHFVQPPPRGAQPVHFFVPLHSQLELPLMHMSTESSASRRKTRISLQLRGEDGHHSCQICVKDAI